MRLIIIFLFTLALSSCTNRKQDFEFIDFMAYGYIKVPTNNEQYAEEWKLVSPIYLYIDNDYYSQFVFERPLDSMKISSLKIDGKKSELKDLVSEIIDSSESFTDDLDLRPNRLSFYHGLELIIKITYKNRSKTIHFWQGQKNSQNYEKLFKLADQIYKKNKTNFECDSLILKRRFEFMLFARQSDSVLRPLSPLPPRDVIPEYIPPKVDSSLLE